VTTTKLQFQLDAIGDLLAARHGILVARKRRIHLFWTAQVKLVPLHPHPIHVGAELARVDA